MWSRTLARTLGRVRAPAPAVTLALAVCGCVWAGVALAAMDSVHVRGPRQVRRGKPYTITLHGTAARRERWYLFVDYHRCGPNPAVEHTRADGFYGTVDKGSFNHSSPGWKSYITGTDHACVYLTRLSARLNGASGVVARASAKYVVAP